MATSTTVYTNAYSAALSAMALSGRWPGGSFDSDSLATIAAAFATAVDTEFASRGIDPQSLLVQSLVRRFCSDVWTGRMPLATSSDVSLYSGLAGIICDLIESSVTKFGTDSIDLVNADAVNTVHFDIGRIGTPTIASTPGTPDLDALSVFGQLNISTYRTIRVIHQHLIKGGTGDLNIDIFRRRSGEMTYLGALEATDPTDYNTAALVPASPSVQPGDYLYAQVTRATASPDGLTVDIHFDSEV